MVAEAPSPQQGSVRRAQVADYPWIVATGAAAYRELGDYARILPTWLDQPGMMAWIEQDWRGRGRGFAMLGFYTEHKTSSSQVVADLLALAVLPSYQRGGIGTRLLHHVIEVAERITPIQTGTLRLTVAENNRGAQRLYARNAFTIVDGTAMYARGQRALRMVRILKRPVAQQRRTD